jgi:hypothetical protein
MGRLFLISGGGCFGALELWQAVNLSVLAKDLDSPFEAGFFASTLRMMCVDGLNPLSGKQQSALAAGVDAGFALAGQGIPVARRGGSNIRASG